MKEFNKLIKIMRILLGKKGCPWTKSQNHNKLLKYLKEETKEFEIAVKNKDFNNMKEELGDLLLQVVFHSEIARLEKKFNIENVIDNLNKKLIRRHPHIFGKNKTKVKTAKDVSLQWERIKKLEKKGLK